MIWYWIIFIFACSFSDFGFGFYHLDLICMILDWIFVTWIWVVLILDGMFVNLEWMFEFGLDWFDSGLNVSLGAGCLALELDFYDFEFEFYDPGLDFLILDWML